MTQTSDELRRRLEQEGHWVSPDGRVRPEAAAAVLDRSPKTLRAWRAAGEVVIPFQRVRGRITYSLADIIVFLDANTIRQEGQPDARTRP